MININNVSWEKLQAEDIKQQILKTESSENFFFEFKEDEESTTKLMKEISAFANTYGGYIFIGISDNKTLKGCKRWTENRIHTTIHDSISPIPIFDVKVFSIDGVDILVIRIEEGVQPPYIVNDGRIYERVSSGSFPIKDSAKLTELYRKHRNYLNDIAKTIELEPVDVHTQWFPQNLCGCIDVGVYIKCRDRMRIYDDFHNANIRDAITSILRKYEYDYSISMVGARILITIAKKTATDNNNNPIALSGGIQNYFEILNDGSFRYRILLALDKDSDKANITGIDLCVNVFSSVYKELVGDSFCENFIYCEKCERLSVFRQFTPYYYLSNENTEEAIRAHEELFNDHIQMLDGNIIVAGNRYPTVGYSHYDHDLFNQLNITWESITIIDNLFDTIYSNLGFLERAKW